MQESITYVGLDVHKDTITGAVLPGLEPRIAETKTFPSDTGHLVKWLKRLKRKWERDLRICYEASGAGYVLYRELTARGFDVMVVAPSLIPQKPGDARKTDKIDAGRLAFELRNGSLTAVHVPDREDEGVRALVRLRRAIVEEITSVKHQTLCHLRRNGWVYRDGTNWTVKHRRWLDAVKLPQEDEQYVHTANLRRLALSEAERAEVETRIRERVSDASYVDRVARVTCLKGLDVIGGVTMVVEVGDFSRFPDARSFMSFVGLTPGVWQTGGTRQAQVGITKAGNAHCRRILVEAAWSIVSHKPTAGKRLRERWKGQPAWVLRHANRAITRLHDRYRKLVSKGMLPQKAITAVARELAGFVWAVMQLEEVAGCREAA